MQCRWFFNFHVPPGFSSNILRLLPWVMALSDSRGSLWTQFTTHPPSSESTSVTSHYRDGRGKKNGSHVRDAFEVWFSFSAKRHIFATKCLSSWCNFICVWRRWCLLPSRNRRQRHKSHPCVSNWATSPAAVGFNNILLYNFLHKWPAGLEVSLETYFRGMCFIATVNFMRAVKWRCVLPTIMLLESAV